MSGGFAAIDRARRNGGFLSELELRHIAADPWTRLTPMLVRCGGGRFTAPAQDVAHFVAIIEADGRDYVRDVSLPARGV